MSSKNLNLVHHRGGDSFFDDPFFKDSWDDFDRTMQSTQSRFHANRGARLEGSTSGSDIGHYQQQQQQQQQQQGHQGDGGDLVHTGGDDMHASQALQVTEKDGKFQVVMDVKDFNPRDLQVRAVDDKIVVEGKYQKAAEDGKSSSVKTFYKEFVFPHAANIDNVSTALSKDGVLTVKAPRKEGYEEVEEPSPMNKSGSGGGPHDGTGSTQSPFDSLPRDMRERLLLAESGYSSPHSSNCSSPVPSETGSDTSRVSSAMDFHNMGKKSPYPQSDLGFTSGTGSSAPPTPAPTTPFPSVPSSIAESHAPSRAASGKAGATEVSVSEENGRRVLTSQTSNMVQEKDGFMEHKETAAEVTDKDSQAARREAQTRMARTEEDPEGRFKRAEATDAAEINETCVKTLPDGSVMHVKKSSTSTSSQSQSFSSNAGRGMGFPSLMDDPDFGFGRSAAFRNTGGFGHPGFGSDFGDLRSLMGRGHQLMSQMSTDSMASTLSGRSGFSDMSNFSNFTDASTFSDMSNFSRLSDLSNMSSMSHHRMPQMMSTFGKMGADDPNRLSKSSSSSSKSSFSSPSVSKGFSDF